jgi:anhydro-N-acetylmuramic acid kinase
MTFFIGLMSGTSLDGIDAVVVDFGARGGAGSAAILAHVHHPLDPDLRGTLRELGRPGDNELHRAALAGNALAIAYAGAVQALLDGAALRPSAITCVGAHGQTVRHRPGEFDATGYTLQLLNGALLAERCGIDVVCDLRSRDIAAGGQGAPLVPAFHASVFRRPGADRAVLNLGGIANLTMIKADGGLSGFDCGPGNTLLDIWCQRHQQRPYDDAGAWSAGGRVDDRLLAQLLDDPFIRCAPPKSTGLDRFHADWLAAKMQVASAGRLDAIDVQATLAEMTARCATDALRQHLPAAEDLLVCGGGALNADLMRRLQATVPPRCRVVSTAQAGIAPQQVEAAAFAWLAKAFFDRQPGNRIEVTGATGPRILGALYPA